MLNVINGILFVQIRYGCSHHNSLCLIVSLPQRLTYPGVEKSWLLCVCLCYCNHHHVIMTVCYFLTELNFDIFDTFHILWCCVPVFGSTGI
jgi:hypothetical protein